MNEFTEREVKQDAKIKELLDQISTLELEKRKSQDQFRVDGQTISNLDGTINQLYDDNHKLEFENGKLHLAVKNCKGCLDQNLLNIQSQVSKLVDILENVNDLLRIQHDRIVLLESRVDKVDDNLGVLNRLTVG